ncbi:MAG: outer membrane beta-barrel protein [Saprospiraceae bacterium]
MNVYQRVKIFTIITLFSCGIIGYTNAQKVDLDEDYTNEPLKVRLTGMNLNMLFPQSTFKKKLGDEKGFGIGGFMLYQIQPLSPHFLGFDIEYDHLYSEESNFNGLEERINSGYVSINFNWRIFPDFKISIIEPYFEAFIGPNFIFTSTNVLDENGQSVEFDFNQTSFGLEYGIGGGFTIPFSNNWFFDFQFIRSQTSIARYLILPDDSSDFREVNSANDHNKIKLGVLYAF